MLTNNKRVEMTIKNGSVEEASTIKAGCGIRYDPEQLSDHSGFDYSDAKNLIADTEACESTDDDSDQKKKA